MGICIVTAAMLYIPEIALLVGRRDLVRTVHLWAGLASPVPLVVGLIGSAGFRADVRRLNRFSPFDWAWLRPSSRQRRLQELRQSGRIAPEAPYPVGKFNAGQKLNASFTLGATIVMFGTGVVLATSQMWADATRSGATFVHDWLALAVTVVVLGHLWRAYNDSEARRGMRTGLVSVQWARVQHPAWVADQPSTERDVPSNRDGPPT
jgi:formate dehydrogenase subunit gamma